MIESSSVHLRILPWCGSAVEKTERWRSPEAAEVVGGVFQACRVAVKDVGLVPSALSDCLLPHIFQNNTTLVSSLSSTLQSSPRVVSITAELGSTSCPRRRYRCYYAVMLF